jgi:hypothetical protein
MSRSHYETSNVYLAAFLLCQGAVLTGYERVSPRRTLFQFRSDEKLHELLRLYWRNDPQPVVSAQLFASLQRLKSLIRKRPAPPAAPAPSLSRPCPNTSLPR